MQPDQQSNYWQHDSDDKDVNLGKSPEVIDTPVEPAQMYAPSEDEENNLDAGSNMDEGNKRPPVPSDNLVQWNAAEYIPQEKNGSWFIIFYIVALTFIAVDLLLLKSYTFSVLVVVMAAAVIILSRRPPRTINYTLSGDQGLYIDQKLYHFSEFKSFGFIKDQGNNSIMLTPIKRFSPGIFVYFPEEAGEKIIDILGARLPMENLKLDIIDVIVRKLRL